MIQRLLAVWVLICGFSQAQGADPPARVARVSYVAGSAQVQSTETNTFESTIVNWPITEADRLRTGTDSGLEISLETSLIALDASSDVTLLELSPSTTRIALTSGTLSLALRESADRATVIVQRGALAVAPRKAGIYTMYASEGGGLRVVVREGEAYVTTGNAKFQQWAGEASTITSDDDVSVVPVPSMSPFELWSLERARKSRGGRSASHVAAGVLGHEELDAFGKWRWRQDYGMVWEPQRVSHQWSPYRFGRWIWKSPWGWTWVDDTPWGFATTHYGRWLYDEDRWLWIPGPRNVPAVYAPALVGWRQNDREQIGWYPLGPGEKYEPAYPASARHLQLLNTFTVVASRVSAGPEMSAETRAPPHATTWVSRSAFVRPRLSRSRVQ